MRKERRKHGSSIAVSFAISSSKDFISFKPSGKLWSFEQPETFRIKRDFNSLIVSERQTRFLQFSKSRLRRDTRNPSEDGSFFHLNPVFLYPFLAWI